MPATSDSAKLLGQLAQQGHCFSFISAAERTCFGRLAGLDEALLTGHVCIEDQQSRLLATWRAR